MCPKFSSALRARATVLRDVPPGRLDWAPFALADGWVYIVCTGSLHRVRHASKFQFHVDSGFDFVSQLVITAGRVVRFARSRVCGLAYCCDRELWACRLLVHLLRVPLLSCTTPRSFRAPHPCREGHESFLLFRAQEGDLSLPHHLLQSSQARSTLALAQTIELI